MPNSKKRMGFPLRFSLGTDASCADVQLHSAPAVAKLTKRPFATGAQSRGNGSLEKHGPARNVSTHDDPPFEHGGTGKVPRRSLGTAAC